jgi:hypothetical protein
VSLTSYCNLKVLKRLPDDPNKARKALFVINFYRFSTRFVCTRINAINGHHGRAVSAAGKGICTSGREEAQELLHDNSTHYHAPVTAIAQAMSGFALTPVIGSLFAAESATEADLVVSEVAAEVATKVGTEARAKVGAEVGAAAAEAGTVVTSESALAGAGGSAGDLTTGSEAGLAAEVGSTASSLELSHEAVAAIWELSESDGLAAIPQLDGGFIKTSPLSFREVCDIGPRFEGGLREASEKGALVSHLLPTWIALRIANELARFKGPDRVLQRGFIELPTLTRTSLAATRAEVIQAISDGRGW